MTDENNKLSVVIQKPAKQNYHAFKFGWDCVNFNYFIFDEELKFICDAISQIDEHDWKLLPFYK